MIDTDISTAPQEARQALDMQALAQLDAHEVMQTPEFQAWAGEGWQDDGEVLTGPDGAPLFFYHGGDTDISEFSTHQTPNTADEQTGMYFTSRLPNAKYYADKLKIAQAERGLPEKASVYGVFLKIKNPMILDRGAGFRYERQDAPVGIDGVINTKTQEAVVYDPSQIFIAGEAKR